MGVLYFLSYKIYIFSVYRFSAHHSNLTHNIQQIKMKIFATSVVREKSKAEMIWHESYLESIGEIGKIFFLGLHNLEENSATLPRKSFIIWFVRFDQPIWPSNLIDQSDRPIWSTNLTVQFDRLIWPSLLTVRFGRTIWPFYFTVNFDRSILPANLADLSGRQIKSLLWSSTLTVQFWPWNFDNGFLQFHSGKPFLNNIKASYSSWHPAQSIQW